MPQPPAFSFGGMTLMTISAIPQPVDEDDDDESSLQLTEQGRANHVMGEVPKPLPRRCHHSKRKTMPQGGMNSTAWTEPALVAQPNVPHHNNFFALTKSDEERPQRIYARRARNMPRLLQPTHFSNESGRPKLDNPTNTIRQVYRTVNTKPQWHPKCQRMMAQETVPQEIQTGESQPPHVPVASSLTFPKTSVAERPSLKPYLERVFSSALARKQESLRSHNDHRTHLVSKEVKGSHASRGLFCVCYRSRRYSRIIG